MKKKPHSLIPLLVVAFVGGFAATVLAQGFTTPLYMASVQPIEDEFGNTLQGHAEAPGDLVVTYRAVNDVIQPPATNGLPHPDNVEVVGGTSGVGSLAPMGLTKPGVFGLAITGDGRPSHGQKVFVRVFNHASITGASFYADSQLITVSGNTRFPLAFNATETPIDPADDDVDGLNNSYEKSLGTDKGNPDSDGDGMNDGNEFGAGTDLLDENSNFAVSVIAADGGDLLLTWSSVIGRDYQVQACQVLANSGGFSNVGSVVTATSTVSEIRIPDEFLNAFFNYRVEVLPE